LITIHYFIFRYKREFDFMRGDEEYKYRFGGMNRFVMWGKVTL